MEEVGNCRYGESRTNAFGLCAALQSFDMILFKALVLARARQHNHTCTHLCCSHASANVRDFCPVGVCISLPWTLF